MNAKTQLVAQLRQSLGDLREVEAQLRGNGVRALLERTVRERAVIVPPVNVSVAASPRSTLDTQAAEQLLVTGRQSLQRLQQQGDAAELSAQEILGLEAVRLLVSRPAIFVQGGDFVSPPEPWGPLLDQERDSIRRVFQSVGRIEVFYGAGRPELIGTGFLVAPEVVMTNRHVVASFCEQPEGRWRFMQALAPSIDYRGEREGASAASFELLEVLGVHSSPQVDLALLRVSRQAGHGHAAPEPLTLASAAPDSLAGRDVYAVGYPAADRQGLTPPQVLRGIFGEEYEVKRLQPGKLLGLEGSEPGFRHDCSTLGGNSGSCVVDLKTGLVIGLHYGGSYRRANYAVALWMLRDDPLLRSAGVQFD